MRAWAWTVVAMLDLSASGLAGLAWMFGTNRYLWMGEGEYCDLDSPALIQALAGLACLLVLGAAALWLPALGRLTRRARTVLALISLLLLGASALRWVQASAAERHQTALGCAG